MRRTVEWYREYYNGGDVVACTRRQIAEYTNASALRNAAVAAAI
jgi:hypothetical protein